MLSFCKCSNGGLFTYYHVYGENGDLYEDCESFHIENIDWRLQRKLNGHGPSLAKIEWIFHSDSHVGPNLAKLEKMAEPPHRKLYLSILHREFYCSL